MVFSDYFCHDEDDVSEVTKKLGKYNIDYFFILLGYYNLNLPRRFIKNVRKENSVIPIPLYKLSKNYAELLKVKKKTN